MGTTCTKQICLIIIFLNVTCKNNWDGRGLPEVMKSVCALTNTCMAQVLAITWVPILAVAFVPINENDQTVTVPDSCKVILKSYGLYTKRNGEIKSTLTLHNDSQKYGSKSSMIYLLRNMIKKYKHC